MKSKLSADVFNQMACFGQESSGEKEKTTALLPLYNTAGDSVDSIIRQEPGTLLNLFIQGTILSAYLLRVFPDVFEEDPVQQIIYEILQVVCGVIGAIDVRPVMCVQIFTRTLGLIKTGIQDTITKARQGKGVKKDELSLSGREQYIHSCDMFFRHIENEFLIAQKVFVRLTDDMDVTKEVIDCSLKFIAKEHEYGKSWVEPFLIMDM